MGTSVAMKGGGSSWEIGNFCLSYSEMSLPSSGLPSLLKAIRMQRTVLRD